MGDTLVKSIRDITLYVGEFTILPSGTRTKRRVIRGIEETIHGKLQRGPRDMAKEGPSLLKKGHKDVGDEGEGGVYEQNPGLVLPAQSKPEDDQSGTDGNAPQTGHRAAERVTGAYERQEEHEADVAHEHGDILGENVHHYHYLLAREIGKVMKHLSVQPPKQYTYDEWKWYLKLMGEDEGSPDSHRTPRAKIKKGGKRGDKNGAPKLGQGEVTEEEDAEVQGWSWLGNRSPLMGDKEEAEWVLERLCGTLERELKKQREDAEKGEKAEEPPVDRTEGNERPFSKSNSEGGSSSSSS